MLLRTLGAHNVETRATRMAGHIIDGAIALDAGSLTRTLPLDEQRAVRAILLSHRHFDHVKDLPALGIAVRGDLPAPIDVYGIPDAIDAVCDTLMNGRLFPDFRASPSPDAPVYRFHAVDFHAPFNALGYTITAVPAPHSVPAAGFLIERGGVSLFYTGDAGPGISAAWEHVAPDVLLAETTFGSANAAAARAAGHLTPAMLADVLNAFRKRHNRLPRVLITHINPAWEDAVRAELPAVAQDTGARISVAEPDAAIDLRAELRGDSA